MKKLFIFIIIFTLNLFCLEPPRKGELKKLKEEGKFEKRLEFANKLGNHLLKVEKIKQNRSYGLPSKGMQKIFVLLVEFPDYPHTIPASTIKSSLFGEGIKGYYPLESLKNFYLRSSYNQLEITGEVFGWYKTKSKRNNYTNNAEKLIKEVLNEYDFSTDFSQFDNDGDGVIDYFAVYWTGPDEGWASFWWGWNGVFGDSNYRIDEKKLYNFTWQWEEEGAGTIIHETGHALGLPDYYDYDDSIGPSGGLGGMDIMDGWGDHNGFSKWILGWLEPFVLTSSLSNISLKPQSTYPEVAVIEADFNGLNPYGEYFLIQNRQKIANDLKLPGSGFLIFHVDSRVGCEGEFLYDNSYTEHKLLRVMEADGKEEIEKNRYGDEGDFYNTGNSFTPKTFPSSHLYNGSSSGVWIRDISFAGNVGNANFILSHFPPLSKPKINIKDRSTISIQNPTLSWENVPNNTGYKIELHSGANTLLRVTISKDINFYTIPELYIYNGAVLSLWVKASADEENYSSSPYEKINFIIECKDEVVFFKRTYDPPPCLSFMPALSYDLKNNKIVVFGGKESTATEEYDGKEWKIYENNPSPPRRWYTTSAYDPISDGILLFGGWDFVENIPLGDTWFYDTKKHSWEEKTSFVSPLPDWACKMSTNLKDKYILLYCPGSTYKWDGKEWKSVPNSNTPEIYYTDIAYISKLNGFILFGGIDYNWNYSANTYFFYGSKWQLLNLSSNPTQRSFLKLLRDPFDGGVFLFGGEENWEYLVDLWKFDGEKWEEIPICSDFPFELWPPLGDYFEKDRYFYFTNGSGIGFELSIPYKSKHKRPF